MDTFQNKIIKSEIINSYDDNPTKSNLFTSPEGQFMFAVGLTGINLNDNLRYFDITLNNKATLKTSEGKIKTIQNIPL